MDLVDVTVVMPALNKAETIAAAISSVNRQDVRAAEIIVIDDGSSDATAQVAEDLGARVIVSPRNEGSALARNRGVESASTEWIAFLDADDQWLPDHLRTALGAAGTHDLVTTVAVDSKGRRWGNVQDDPLYLSPTRLFFPENPVSTSSTIARRNALLDAGLFRPFQRAQDLDMWVRILERGTGVALGEVTTLYTTPPAGVDYSLHAKNIAGVKAVADSYSDRHWMTRRLRLDLNVRCDWDDMRSALRIGQWRQVFLAAFRLLSNYRTGSSLPRLLIHRWQARGGD